MTRAQKAEYGAYVKAWYSDLDTPRCDRQLLRRRDLISMINSPNTWQIADDFDIVLLE
jgi:hypothetical protein